MPDLCHTSYITICNMMHGPCFSQLLCRHPHHRQQCPRECYLNDRALYLVNLHKCCNVQGQTTSIDTDDIMS